MEIKRSRRVHLIVKETYEPEPVPEYILDEYGLPWIDEAAVVPKGAFNQLGFWKPPIGRSKVTILNADIAQLEQDIVGEIVANYMEDLVNKLKENLESIQDSFIVFDSVASTIKGDLYEWDFYDSYYKKFRGQRHQECFTLDPIYINQFTKPHMADMRLHIFRPKLRSNHPKN